MRRGPELVARAERVVAREAVGDLAVDRALDRGAHAVLRDPRHRADDEHAADDRQDAVRREPPRRRLLRGTHFNLNLHNLLHILTE